MFQAAIFDMDGLLIDSEPLWHKAEITVFASVGVHLTPEQCRETTGVRIDEVVRLRHRQQPWSNKSLAQVEAEIVEEVQYLALHEGCAMPGVQELLEELARRRFRIALASSSPLSMIRTVVNHLGLAPYFSRLSSATSEAQGKPHPGVYLSTAAALAMPPRACLAFEDSVPGVLSAHAAGMSVVAVPDPHHYARAEFEVAIMKLPTLIEFLTSPFLSALPPLL